MGRKTVQRRLVDGWDVEKALTTPAREQHGETDTRLHKLWRSMRKRCNTKSSTGYCRYGARGIEVCKEWDSYKLFKVWAYSNGYSESLSIDRVNPNGNYCPENCRWIPLSENVRIANLGKVLKPKKYLTAWSETKGLKDWVQDCRCQHHEYLLLKDRIRSGWSAEEAISIPKNVGGRGVHVDKYTCWGETKSISQWIEDGRCKCSSAFSLYYRFNSPHWTPEKALTVPVSTPEERAKLGTKNRAKHYLCWGEKKTLREWVQDDRSKCTLSALMQRLNKGVDIETALVTPSHKGNKFNRGVL